MTYATEEDRVAARRATWGKYNAAHRAERAAHNREYSKQAHVKAKKREAYLRSRESRRSSASSLPAGQSTLQEFLIRGDTGST